MTAYALVASTGAIIQIDASIFPVAAPFLWTTDISSVSPAPQVGWTAAQTNGAWSFTAPPAPPAPTAAQVAATAYAAFIADGLNVTSTGTSALNGVYPIDASSQQDIATEAQFISTFSEFTNGTTTNLLWQLRNGNPVTFPTTAEFMAYAKVAAQTVAAAKLAVAQAAAMPPASVTIA